MIGLVNKTNYLTGSGNQIIELLAENFCVISDKKASVFSYDNHFVMSLLYRPSTRPLGIDVREVLRSHGVDDR